MSFGAELCQHVDMEVLHIQAANTFPCAARALQDAQWMIRF
jgi:hypothetical protein